MFDTSKTCIAIRQFHLWGCNSLIARATSKAVVQDAGVASACQKDMICQKSRKISENLSKILQNAGKMALHVF